MGLKMPTFQGIVSIKLRNQTCHMPPIIVGTKYMEAIFMKAILYFINGYAN